MEDPSYIRGYGMIPVFRRGEELLFLVIQHTERLGNHWKFPKGRAEVGETPIETARREFEEEVGITAYMVDETMQFEERYTTITFAGKKVSKVVGYFLAYVENDAVIPQEDEIQDYTWLPYEKARERITYPETKQVIDKAYQYIKKEQS